MIKYGDKKKSLLLKEANFVKQPHLIKSRYFSCEELGTLTLTILRYSLFSKIISRYHTRSKKNPLRHFTIVHLMVNTALKNNWLEWSDVCHRLTLFTRDLSLVSFYPVNTLIVRHNEISDNYQQGTVSLTI